MSLNKVLYDWWKWGLTPEGFHALTPEEEARFIGDVCTANADWLFDVFAEALNRDERTQRALAEAIGSRDFLQGWAIMDALYRKHFFEDSLEFFQLELQTVIDQNTPYVGD